MRLARRIAISGGPAIWTKYSLSSSMRCAMWQMVASMSVKLSCSLIVALPDRLRLAQLHQLLGAHPLVQHFLMGGHAVYPLLQVLVRAALGLSGGKLQPVLYVAAVEPRSAARVRSERCHDDGIHKVVGDGGPLGLPADGFGVDDLLGGD